jgi:pilus assembly protein Flp/PilA
MTKFVARFVKDETGVTALEYGMIAALVSVAILTALGTIGTQLNTTFTNIGTALTNANAE